MDQWEEFNIYIIYFILILLYISYYDNIFIYIGMEYTWLSSVIFAYDFYFHYDDDHSNLNSLEIFHKYIIIYKSNSNTWLWGNFYVYMVKILI